MKINEHLFQYNNRETKRERERETEKVVYLKMPADSENFIQNIILVHKILK